MKEEIKPDVIGYFIQDNIVVICNPCSIPIEMLEDTIKQHKKSKDKKLVTSVCCIAIPINIKGLKGTKMNGIFKKTNTRIKKVKN